MEAKQFVRENKADKMYKLLSCPFCKIQKLTGEALAAHCLGEIRAQTSYVCSRCKYSKPRRRKDQLETDRHPCFANNLKFQVEPHSYTLEGIKALLKPQGVTAYEVDQMAVEMSWQPPRNIPVTVDPAVVKSRNTRPPPVRDALLGESGLNPKVRKVELPSTMVAKVPKVRGPPSSCSSLGDPLGLAADYGFDVPEQVVHTTTADLPIINLVDLSAEMPDQPSQPPVMVVDALTQFANLATQQGTIEMPKDGEPSSQEKVYLETNYAMPGLDYKICDSRPIVPDWARDYHTDLSTMGVVVPMERTEYFWNSKGVRYMRFPAVLKDTDTFVYVVSPAASACPETILRDCPVLTSYKPQTPASLPWTGLPLAGIPCSFIGLLYQDLSAGLDKLSLIL